MSSSSPPLPPDRPGVCRTPGANITAYFTTMGKERTCQRCSHTFAKSSSGDTLKNHMHRAHKQFATEMRISLSSFLQLKTSSSQSSLSRHREDAIEVEDNSPSTPPMRPSTASVSSSSSSSSSSSPSSSASVASDSTVTIFPSTNKRISMAPPSPQQPKRMRQQSIRQFDATEVQRSTEAREAQIDFFLLTGLSFRIADSDALHRWLELFRLGDGSILGRRALAVGLQSRVEGVMEQVVNRLRACNGVTIGVDGWTNVRHDKVINICPVGRGVAYYWNSVVLREYADADSQYGPLSTQIAGVIAKGILVVALVTDNEAVNGAVHRRLLVDYPFLIHVPCAAHTIQLCVRKVMGLPVVESIVGALQQLLAAFRGSKELRVNMKAQQALLRRGRPPLQLVTVCDTRWNSLLFAAERVLELEQCIRPFVSDIVSIVNDENYTYCDSSFWHPLKALVYFLLPFRVATDVVQSDTATLADVHEQFAALMVAADRLTVPHPFAPVRVAVMSCIRVEWDAHVNLNAVVMSALFSFSPSYGSFSTEQVAAADAWFEVWGTEFLLYYGLTESDDRDSVTVLLQNQLSAFNQREGAFADLDASRTRRAKVAEKERKLDDPRTLWGLKVRAVPELTACALALLELTASEAAVERSFSRQGLVHSKQRNRLADDTVHLSMAFAFNVRALSSSARHVTQGWEELPDNYVPTDIVRGTALLCCADEELAAAASDSEEEVRDRRRDDAADAEARRERDMAEEKAERYMMEERERTEEERIDAFVHEYVRKHHITRGYRFGGAKEAALMAALIEAGLTTQVVDMKKRIVRHVAAAEAAPPPPPEVE